VNFLVEKNKQAMCVYFPRKYAKPF